MAKFTYLIFVFLLILQACNRSNESDLPNVLFISIDDLRNELGAYGKSHIVSPNLDKLASEGCLFTNHFVNIPTCGASRYTLLTGRLPLTTGEIGNEAIRNNLSSAEETELPETFIHHLKRSGYYTVGIGKISHYPDGLLYAYNDSVGSCRELPYSWDELIFDSGKWGTGWNAFFAYADGSNRQSMKKQVKPYERTDAGDNAYPDGLSAELAIAKLKQLALSDKPFFMGLGFFKPHLPFNAPAKYWDMYNTDSIPLSEVPFIPANVNRASLHGSNEFNQYLLGEEKASLDSALSEEYSLRLRQGYFACISYIDALVGKVIAELKNLDLYDNTIIVIWGDHGWHLGDHLMWGKHSIFEESLKSTLIIKAPGKDNVVINDVVSTLDIYPTIVDLCGLEQVPGTRGRALGLLIDKPGSGIETPAFSYFRRGISMRTSRYRLSKYYREAAPQLELYDHWTDPFETTNIEALNIELRDSLLLILEEKGNTGLYR
ncbi:MAG: sulfatase [Bacteroidales bacterium]|nr:sulfatase [Bacteroidales bacterium]